MIGSSLSALVFAYRNAFPIVAGTLDRPFEFEFFAEPFMGFADEAVLKTNTGDLSVGTQKLKVWNHLFFTLSLDGLVCMGDMCRKIIADFTNKKIKAFSSFMGREANFTFDRAYVFDHELAELSGELLTRDWLSLTRTPLTQDYDILYPGQDGFREVLLYGTPRRTFNNKDAICVFQNPQHNIQETKFLLMGALEPYAKRIGILQPQHRDVFWHATPQNKSWEIALDVVAMDYEPERI